VRKSWYHPNGKGSALLMCTIREVSAVGSKLQRKRFGDDNDHASNDEFLDNHGSVGTVSHSGADYGPTSQRTSEA